MVLQFLDFGGTSDGDNQVFLMMPLILSIRDCLLLDCLASAAFALRMDGRWQHSVFLSTQQSDWRHLFPCPTASQARKAATGLFTLCFKVFSNSRNSSAEYSLGEGNNERSYCKSRATWGWNTSSNSHTSCHCDQIPDTNNLKSGETDFWSRFFVVSVRGRQEGGWVRAIHVMARRTQIMEGAKARDSLECAPVIYFLG